MLKRILSIRFLPINDSQWIAEHKRKARDDDLKLKIRWNNKKSALKIPSIAISVLVIFYVN